MSDGSIAQAARNNAEWCHVMYRAHGRRGLFGTNIWHTPDAALPLYPNAVSLTGAPAGQCDLIDCLLADLAAMPRALAVKDSFLTLDLGSFGFEELFLAEWIHLPAREIGRKIGPSHGRWERVASPAQLAQWERAWRNTADGLRLFPPSLLAQEDHAIIAVYHKDDIVAGCVASHAAGAVGISNLFVPAKEADTYRHDCISAAIACYPDLPLVGYERGSDLAAMTMLGFQAIGPLRIWLREESTGFAS